MATQYSRQTAVPCNLGELQTGIWVQNDGIVPSGIKTERGLISRVSAIGVIIDKQNDLSFSLDDGTNIITVRSFEAKPVPVHADIGDIVLVIGRPREYNSQRYIVLEICKKLKHNGWTEYRKRELAVFYNTQPTSTQQYTPAPPTEGSSTEPHTITVEATTQNPFEILVAKIRETDTGSGADIEEIITTTNVNDAEKLLRTLLEEGEIFEIRPGKLKVLE